MLAELENGLLDLVRASALAARLRQVESLPDLEGDSLLGRFATESPALYVALGSFPVRRGVARPKYGIACVARNSRGHKSARLGDGMTIGLYEMLEAALVLFDGATVSTGADADGAPEVVAFEVTGCEVMASEALFQKGIYAGVVQVQTVAELRLPPFLTGLSEFKVLQTAYDVDPHQAATEHAKWLAEPPDFGSSVPELSDSIQVKE